MFGTHALVTAAADTSAYIELYDLIDENQTARFAFNESIVGFYLGPSR